MDPFPRAVEPCGAKIVIHRLPGRPFLRQETPGASRAELVEHHIEQRAPRMQTGTASARQGGQQGPDEAPFGVGQIGGIELGTHRIHPTLRLFDLKLAIAR